MPEVGKNYKMCNSVTNNYDYDYCITMLLSACMCCEETPPPAGE